MIKVGKQIIFSCKYFDEIFLKIQTPQFLCARNVISGVYNTPGKMTLIGVITYPAILTSSGKNLNQSCLISVESL